MQKLVHTPRNRQLPLKVRQAQDVLSLMVLLQGMPYTDLAHLHKADLNDTLLTCHRQKTGTELCEKYQSYHWHGHSRFPCCKCSWHLGTECGTITLATTATITFTATAGTSQLPGNIGAPKPVAYGLVAPKAKDETSTNPISLNLVLGQKSASTNDRTLTAANAALFNGEWKKGHRYTYNLATRQE